MAAQSSSISSEGWMGLRTPQRPLPLSFVTGASGNWGSRWGTSHHNPVTSRFIGNTWQRIGFSRTASPSDTSSSGFGLLLGN